MPEISVRVPDGLLQVATATAAERGRKLDDLYVEAIERYLRVTSSASAGSVRSRFLIPRSSPQIVIDIPQELIEQVEAAAGRQEKRPAVMCADALAYYLKATGAVNAAEGAVESGHDLPSGAYRPKA
jgi:hypothetical protein